MKTVCSSAIQPAVTYAINRRKDLFKFARRILPATIANKNELNPEAKMSFQKVCSVINPSLPSMHACMLYARRSQTKTNILRFHCCCCCSLTSMSEFSIKTQFSKNLCLFLYTDSKTSSFAGVQLCVLLSPEHLEAVNGLNA